MRKQALTSHGTAAWAGEKDLRRAGMLGGGGLCVGEIATQRPRFWEALKGLFNRRKPAWDACRDVMVSMRVLQRFEGREAVRLNNAVHTAVFAPTGAGKGVSLIIPHLLECSYNCVVIDPKGENYKLTAEARRAMGHRVIVVDPFKVVTQTPDTLNPLSILDPDDPLTLDGIRAVANEIVVRTGNEPDPHWNDSAEGMITTSSVIAVSSGEGKENLQTVRQLLSDEKYRNASLEKMRALDDWGGVVSRLAAQALNLRDKELAGVISSANRHTAFLDSVPVAESTKASSFDPRELRRGKMTVFLVLPTQYLRSQSALMRLWVGTLLRGCVAGGLGDDKVHFVLDEAASLGRMDALEDAVDKMRGYGVRLQFYYQSAGQLKQCWREGMDASLLSNCTQVYFGVNDLETATRVSDQLGEATIIIDSGGSNAGGSTTRNIPDASSSRGESWGSSSNWQRHGRKLLKPEEVLCLDNRHAVTFAPGVRPIATRLTRYYEPRPKSRWGMTAMEIWLTAAGMAAAALMCVWGVLNLK